MRRIDPDGVWQIVAMRPGGGPVASLNCRVSEDPDAIIDFVNQNDGVNNLYWTTGEIRPGVVEKHKPLGEHVVFIRLAHVDIDLPGANTEEELERLLAEIRRKMPAGVEAFIISSGGGYQLIFVLDQKMPVAEAREAIEALNNGLIAHFGGDKGTWNVERLARMPGTQNVPDAIKRAKGRVQRKAFLLASTDAKHSIASLGRLIPPVVPEETGDRSERVNEAIAELRYAPHEMVMSIGDLPIPLADLLDEAMKAQPKIRRALAGDYSGTAAANGSGKRAMVALLFAHHADLTLEEFAMLIWLWAVSAEGVDYAEQKLTPRDIARLYARKVEPVMQKRAEKIAETVSSGYQDLDGVDQPDSADSADSAAEAKPAVRLLPYVSFEEAAESALELSNQPLVEGLLDQGTLSVVYGPSNAGKTFVAMGIGFHIAEGLPWGGMDTTKGIVLYVAAEGGSGARKRVRALQKHFNREGRAVGMKLVLSTINLLDPKADLEPIIATMRKIGTDEGSPVVFLVIDTFSRVFAGGEENGSTDMGTMVTHFDRIRQATSAHVCIVHHSGKDLARGSRGHSLLRAATDTEIEVANGLISVTKQRDLEGDYAAGFRLRQVEIGTNSKGRPVTSAVTELIPKSEAGPGVATPAEQIVLDAIHAVAHTLNAEQATFKQRDVLDVLSEQDKTISADGLRQHFKKLIAKRFIESPSKGQFRLRRQIVSHSDYFEPIEENEAVKSHSEQTGANFGAGVFD